MRARDQQFVSARREEQTSGGFSIDSVVRKEFDVVILLRTDGWRKKRDHKSATQLYAGAAVTESPCGREDVVRADVCGRPHAADNAGEGAPHVHGPRLLAFSVGGGLGRQPLHCLEGQQRWRRWRRSRRRTGSGLGRDGGVGQTLQAASADHGNHGGRRHPATLPGLPGRRIISEKGVI